MRSVVGAGALVEDDQCEDIGPVILVVVKDEVTRRGIEREGFAQLLDVPPAGRMLRGADVEYADGRRRHQPKMTAIWGNIETGWRGPGARSTTPRPWTGAAQRRRLAAAQAKVSK